MLILSRHKNESIVVSDAQGNKLAEIMVTELRGDKVRLGLTAEKSINIDRQEVFLKRFPVKPE